MTTKTRPAITMATGSNQRVKGLFFGGLCRGNDEDGLVGQYVARVVYIARVVCVAIVEDGDKEER